MAIFMNTEKEKSLVYCVADAALAGIMVSLVMVWLFGFNRLLKSTELRLALEASALCVTR